ncbi:inositol monophosphatase family protein [Actinosynnema sp. CA-248983]
MRPPASLRRLPRSSSHYGTAPRKRHNATARPFGRHCTEGRQHRQRSYQEYTPANCHGEDGPRHLHRRRRPYRAGGSRVPGRGHTRTRLHREEEGRSAQAEDSDCVWALDPIDGTANFVHGVPLSGISLALLRHDRAIVAAVSLPHSGLHYWAAEGKGSRVNGTPIQASSTTELSQAMIAIGDYALGDHAHEKNKQRIALTAALAAKVERIRMFGSAAHDLVWLAEGRLDGAVILSNKTLDIAAGVLIAREAGALVLDSSGTQHSSASTHTIAVAPGIADPLLSLVRSSI